MKPEAEKEAKLLNMSRGERWVRRAGSSAVKSPWMVPFSIGASGFFALLGLLNFPNFNLAISYIALGALWLAVALIWYERLTFYRLIEGLEKRHRSVESQHSDTTEK
jgi:hypothetical protein